MQARQALLRAVITALLLLGGPNLGAAPIITKHTSAPAPDLQAILQGLQVTLAHLTHQLDRLLHPEHTKQESSLAESGDWVEERVQGLLDQFIELAATSSSSLAGLEAELGRGAAVERAGWREAALQYNTTRDVFSQLTGQRAFLQSNAVVAAVWNSTVTTMAGLRDRVARITASNLVCPPTFISLKVLSTGRRNQGI